MQNSDSEIRMAYIFLGISSKEGSLLPDCILLARAPAGEGPLAACRHESLMLD